MISITGNASTVNIANGTPTEGQVMTWQSGNWVGATSAGGTTIEEATNSGDVTINSTATVITSITLSAGTWKVDAVATLLSLGLASDVWIELYNSTTSSSISELGSYANSNRQINISATKKLTLGGSTTIQLRARKGSAADVYCESNKGFITAIK